MLSIKRWRRGMRELSLIIHDGATLRLYNGGQVALNTNYPMGQEDKARADAEAIADLGGLKFVGTGAESYAAAR